MLPTKKQSESEADQFHEHDSGKYFAYYGRSSDCFLVELKDGRKYLLGCKNAPLIFSPRFGG
ncbi:MAG: hypothetical protein E7119_08940 [Bacteroidales bacterium]|nr:hypothetical protein [Bacteroidales bacterium]